MIGNIICRIKGHKIPKSDEDWILSISRMDHTWTTCERCNKRLWIDKTIDGYRVSDAHGW